MIKPILRSIASTETVDVPKFRFMEYRVGETYHNNESFIDFVTDGNELYVCAVDTVVASANKISDQANMLKLVSKGEPGRDGAEGRQGLPGHAPNIYAKFEGDQLSIYADGRRIATTTGITGPAWKPKKINNTITWERSFDDEIPASINLNELRSDDYTPILLRANSDNTKRDDETSGPANFIQWKYEGQEEWSNLISISELMNLALAGVSIWLDENDGQYHLGHREVVKASYASSKEGPQIISDVELGDVLFDAGPLPTIGGGIDPEELEERLQEIIAMIPDLTGYATKEWVNSKGFVRSVNGQTPDANGDVTLSVAGNPIMELRIQNQELQKKSANDSNWVTVGSVGGGSGQGCDRCWSQQEIIDLILNQLSPYGNKSWVLEEITKAITGTLEVEYFRVFTLYKRTNSRTTAPTSPVLNEWTWNTETGVITSSSQNPSWTTHPENATTQTPYLWMASATFSSATKKEVVPQGASNGWTLVCLTGEPGQDGANGYNGTDGADGKGIEFIYHLGSAAPLIMYTTAYKDGYAPKDFDTEVQAKAWWHTLESEDWLPWDGSSNNGHWNDHPESVSDEEGKRIEYASVRTCKYNSVTGVSEWSDFSDPFIWSMWGEDGVDGDGVEYIFFASATQITPVQYPPIHLYNIYNNSNNQSVSSDALIDYNFPKSGYENYQNSEWKPNGWTDNPSDVDAQQPYEYVSIRKYNGATGKWGAFSIPKLWRMLKIESGTNVYRPYTEFAFTRTSLDLTGYLVTGGQSYSDPLEGITTYDDSNPRQEVQITWTDGVPTTSNDPIWCITALIGDEDQQQNAEWTGPWLLKDSTGFQVEYSKSDDAAAVYADPTLLQPFNLNNYKDPTNPYEGIDEISWETAVQLAGYGIWNDNVVDPVYMATAVLGKDGTWSDWVVSRVKGEKGIQGDPGVGTDGADSTGVEFVYYRTKGTKPGIDNTKGKYPGSESEVSFDATKDDWMPKVAGLDAGEIDGTSYWKDHPTGVDSTWTHEWYIARNSVLNNKKRNWDNYLAANISQWSRWSVDGRDGDGVEYVYHLADVDQYNVPVEPDLVETAGQVRIGDALTEVSESNNWKPAGSNIAYPPSITQEFYPSDNANGYWTDDPSGVSSSHPYEYVSVRKYDGINKVWGEFSTPAIWSKYGEDGKTKYTSHIFTRAIGVDQNCTLSNTTVLNEIVTRNSSQNVVTATWTDTIPSTGGVVWMATGVISNGQLENGWSSPCRIGDDVNIQFEFCASEDNDETLPDLNTKVDGQYKYLDSNLDPIEGDTTTANSGFRYDAYINSANNNVWGDEDDITDPVWMAISHRVGGVWSSWIYSRIKGKKGDTGEPGTSVRIVATVPYATDLKNFVDAGASSPNYPSVGDCYIVLEGVLNPSTSEWGQIDPTDPNATYSSSHIWAFGGADADPTDDTNMHLAGFDDLGEFANVTPDKIFIRFAEENNGSAETDTIHTVNVFISGQTVSKHLEMLSVSQSGPFIGIYTGQSSSEVITDYKWSKWDGDDYYGLEQIFLKLEESKTPVWPRSSIIGTSGTDTGRIKGLRKKNPTTGNYDTITPVDAAHYSEFDVLPVVQVSTNTVDDQYWVDTPQEIYDNTTVKYNLWQCTRNIATGVYDWSEPVIYNKYVRDGVDGKFEESVYFRNNTGATPAMSKRFAADENNVTVTDTNNTGIFNKVDVRPYATTASGSPIYGTTPIWTDNPEGVAYNMQYEFISTRKISYNENNEPIYGTFSEPKLLSHWGEDGKDGDGIEYVFFALTDAEHSMVVNNSSYKQVDDSGTYNNKTKDSSEFLPKLKFITRTVGNNPNVEIRATDDNPGVTQTYTHVYASIRRYRRDPQTGISSWGPFSDIALWLVATSEVRKTALLDITNDMEPVWTDSSYHTNSNYFNVGYIYLRTGDKYSRSTIEQIQLNNSGWLDVTNGITTLETPIQLDGTTGPQITKVWITDLKHIEDSEYPYSFYLKLYIDIPSNYIFDEDLSITVSAKDLEDYVGTSVFILHPTNASVKVTLSSNQQLIRVSNENAVDYSTNEVKLSPFFIDYNQGTGATPETGLPFNIAKNVKYYLAIDGNIDTAFTVQGGQYYTFTIANETVTKEQSGFYPASVLYGFSINGSNTEMSASSINQGYNTLLRLTNIDNDDKDSDMWSVLSTLYLNTLPAALKPKRNVIVGVGYANEGVFDKAEIPIIWNGKDGTDGRGIASVEHKFLSVTSEHFNAAKEAPDTEKVIATAFYDDDIWTMDYYDSIYTSDLQNILNDIYNNDGGENLYGESNAVNEDPRTAGTFTIERVTTTYTDNTTDVQYTIIDHIDDVSYLVGAFGEDVDHQNGAILRNFLGVSKTTDHGTNVKAFLNADPNIAKQGEANTLMIAAGVPSTGGSLDARSNAAKFRVYENGDMHATSGSIGGINIGSNSISSSNGNFSVTNTGNLTAKSGTIGGLTINNTNGLHQEWDKDHQGTPFEDIDVVFDLNKEGLHIEETGNAPEEFDELDYNRDVEINSSGITLSVIGETNYRPNIILRSQANPSSEAKELYITSENISFTPLTGGGVEYSWDWNDFFSKLEELRQYPVIRTITTPGDVNNEHSLYSEDLIFIKLSDSQTINNNVWFNVFGDISDTMLGHKWTIRRLVETNASPTHSNHSIVFDFSSIPQNTEVYLNSADNGILKITNQAVYYTSGKNIVVEYYLINNIKTMIITSDYGWDVNIP